MAHEWVRRDIDRIGPVVNQLASRRYTVYRDICIVDIVFICFFSKLTDLQKFELIKRKSVEGAEEQAESELYIKEWKSSLEKNRKRAEAGTERRPKNKQAGFVFDFHSDLLRVCKYLAPEQRALFIYG